MDVIKREDAIKHFKAKADHYRKRLARIEAQGDAIGYDPTEQINGFKDEIAIYEDVVKEIKGIPSAEKQGEWKHLKGDEWLCSNCGYVVWTEGSWEHPLERGKDYCEHCGAHMKGAGDE